MSSLKAARTLKRLRFLWCKRPAPLYIEISCTSFSFPVDPELEYESNELASGKCAVVFFKISHIAPEIPVNLTFLADTKHTDLFQVLFTIVYRLSSKFFDIPSA